MQEKNEALVVWQYVKFKDIVLLRNNLLFLEVNLSNCGRYTFFYGYKISSLLIRLPVYRLSSIFHATTCK